MYDDTIVECLKNGSTVETNCGLKLSLGEIINRSGFKLDEDDDPESSYGFHVDTIEYLQDLDKYDKKKVLAESKNILENQMSLVEGLDQEIIDLYAQQLVDLEEFPNANFFNRESEVTLQVKALSEKGRWFNLGAELTIDIEDLFDVNENVLTSRYIKGKSVLEALMEYYQVEREFLYSKMIDGKINYFCRDQKVMIKSPMLKAGVEVDGVRLHPTAAPFFYSYDPETKETVEKATFFMDQNEIDFCWFNEEGIAKTLYYIVPTTDDESNGDAAILEFNNGIQYGQNIANQAMMSDECTDSIIRAEKDEIRKLELEAKKARRNALTRKDVKAIKDEALLASSIGTIAKSLIEKSKQAKTTREKIAILNEISDNSSKAVEILDAVRAYKRIYGGELAFTYWDAINKIAKQNKEQEFSKLVEGLEHVVKNIGFINEAITKARVTGLDDQAVGRILNIFTDQELVEIREMSYKHGKARKDCWINDPKVSNALTLRYSKIKNVLV